MRTPVILSLALLATAAVSTPVAKNVFDDPFDDKSERLTTLEAGFLSNGRNNFPPDETPIPECGPTKRSTPGLIGDAADISTGILPVDVVLPEIPGSEPYKLEKRDTSRNHNDHMQQQGDLEAIAQHLKEAKMAPKNVTHPAKLSGKTHGEKQ